MTTIETYVRRMRAGRPVSEHCHKPTWTWMGMLWRMKELRNRKAWALSRRFF